MLTTELHALFVSEKEQTANTYQIYLRQAGVAAVTPAHSFRELLAFAQKEMPHLIIFESDLPDMRTILAVRKLREDKSLARTPIIVMMKPSKEEILECVQLRVSAVLPKPCDPNVFIEKMKSVIASFKGLSPYALRGELLDGGDQTSVEFPAHLLGKLGDKVVAMSPLAGADGTACTIVPVDKTLPSVNTFIAGVMRDTLQADKEYTLVSLSQATGKGRLWMQALPEVAMPQGGKRRVLFYETSRERVKPFQEFLAFHKIELEHVDSVRSLAQRFTAQQDSYDVVYMCEPPVGSAAIPWDQAVKEKPDARRPVQVIATSAMSPVQKANTKWLVKPFGIEALVQSFEVAFVQRQDNKGISGLAGDAKKFACAFRFSGRIVALDELGIVLELPFAPVANRPIALSHPKLSAESDFRNVVVAHSEPATGTTPGRYLVRLRATNAEGGAQTLTKAKRIIANEALRAAALTGPVPTAPAAGVNARINPVSQPIPKPTPTKV